MLSSSCHLTALKIFLLAQLGCLKLDLWCCLQFDSLYLHPPMKLRNLKTKNIVGNNYNLIVVVKNNPCTVGMLANLWEKDLKTVNFWSFEKSRGAHYLSFHMFWSKSLFGQLKAYPMMINGMGLPKQLLLFLALACCAPWRGRWPICSLIACAESENLVMGVSIPHFP